MSLTGIQIESIDTKTRWGLILLSDLSIEPAELKSNRIDIPGADGSIDLSYALTNGYPVFNDRQITFNLFKDATDSELNNIRAELAAFCHGRVKKFWLPIDSTHYYRGVFNIGNIQNYNGNIINVSVVAEPYCYKNNITASTVTIPSSGSITKTFTNEMRRTTPKFTTTSENIQMVFNGVQYSLSAGETIFPTLIFDAGENMITFNGTSDATITVSYQEARL